MAGSGGNKRPYNCSAPAPHPTSQVSASRQRAGGLPYHHSTAVLDLPKCLFVVTQVKLSRVCGSEI
eukprot:scaffold61154_cov20-Cyclotella_meneghiniana.AAC.4